MNTTRKGDSYAFEYIGVLQRRGYFAVHVKRRKRKDGEFPGPPFDVVAFHGSPYSDLLLVEAKNDGRGCESAQNLAVRLRNHPSVPGFARVIVVHPSSVVPLEDGGRFCEH